MPTVNEERLALYRAAETKILSGQMVRFGERTLQMPDLAEVRREIAVLQAAVRELAIVVGRGGRFGQADFGGLE